MRSTRYSGGAFSASATAVDSCAARFISLLGTPGSDLNHTASAHVISEMEECHEKKKREAEKRFRKSMRALIVVLPLQFASWVRYCQCQKLARVLNKIPEAGKWQKKIQQTFVSEHTLLTSSGRTEINAWIDRRPTKETRHVEANVTTETQEEGHTPKDYLVNV